jgi:hypothetical protein
MILEISAATPALFTFSFATPYKSLDPEPLCEQLTCKSTVIHALQLSYKENSPVAPIQNPPTPSKTVCP